MNSSEILFLALLIPSAFVILKKMVKSGHFFRCIFLSAVSGIGGLFFVNIISPFTGVSLGANPYTLSFSAVTGLSGTIALLILRLLTVF